ncbi:MAG TPA: mannonate dehydratase [Devosiaceae bacterium]|jgi:mannonate dehydratase
MKQTWRWFGPNDVATIDDIIQAGAEGVVSALHHVEPGLVWTAEAIATRQNAIGRRRDGTPSGLTWDVVESLPVSEAIKTQTGDWRGHLDAYRQSLRHLAAAGIGTICYNFMPLLDWTRTELRWRLPSGGTTMRFDAVDFAAYDIHIVGRPGAAEDFPPAIVAAAGARFAGMDDTRRAAIASSVTMGLPGQTTIPSLDEVRARLAEFGQVSAERLRANLIDFLSEVVPVAEQLGLRLCCHPDDPPYGLLGLARVMSTAKDYRAVLGAVDSPANGMTLCTGALGVRPDNDLPAMASEFGPRVHFVHLRNVRRDAEGSFYESEHLDGDVDMVAVIAALLREEARRRAEGRTDAIIPMRPDHGQDIIDDLGRNAQPGYPIIGRLKGLAELRGVIHALQHPLWGLGA